MARECYRVNLPPVTLPEDIKSASGCGKHCNEGEGVCQCGISTHSCLESDGYICQENASWKCYIIVVANVTELSSSWLTYVSFRFFFFAWSDYIIPDHLPDVLTMIKLCKWVYGYEQPRHFWFRLYTILSVNHLNSGNTLNDKALPKWTF